ncbi:hypothetical protein LINPERPRIM_LOCUS31525 [Linum perenne]
MSSGSPLRRREPSILMPSEGYKRSRAPEGKKEKGVLFLNEICHRTPEQEIGLTPVRLLPKRPSKFSPKVDRVARPSMLTPKTKIRKSNWIESANPVNSESKLSIPSTCLYS